MKGLNLRLAVLLLLFIIGLVINSQQESSVEHNEHAEISEIQKTINIERGFVYFFPRCAGEKPFTLVPTTL